MALLSSILGSTFKGDFTTYPSAGIPVYTGTAWDTSKVAPTGALVGTTDTQTLTNKTLDAGTIITSSNGNTALRITQIGTGYALLIEDEANPDLTPFVIDASGNVGVGTLTPVSKFEVVGTITSTNVVATAITDAQGNVRSIPQNLQTAAYTLTTADNGKHIAISAGGVTVPASIFSIGQVVTIYNNSATAQTITQGSGVTLYNSGDATTGNRTLAGRGLATVLCVAANTFAITGAGLT